MTMHADGELSERRSPVGGGRWLRGLIRPGMLPVLLLLAGLAAACGGDDDSGGGAGTGPVVTPGLGQPCTSECLSGLVCGTSGLFRGQCSAQCSGVASCSMLASTQMTACFGSGAQECGIKCPAGAGCPEGTNCVDVQGQMGCVLSPK